MSWYITDIQRYQFFCDVVFIKIFKLKIFTLNMNTYQKKITNLYTAHTELPDREEKIHSDVVW